ncbi:hypothetical protein ADUPG1_005639, partial [Aduncisulcus paluster]
LAFTVYDDLEGTFKQFFSLFKSLHGQSCAAGNAVVDKDRRTGDLLVHGRGNTTKVIAVCKYKQGSDADCCMFHCVDAAHEMDEILFGSAFDLR